MASLLVLHICLLSSLVAGLSAAAEFRRSKAMYYSSADCLGTSNGACGYGIHGRTINNALVTGVSGLWNNGFGCGACYQVICKDDNLCKEEGITVVVTDASGGGGDADFVLSSHAYGSMARPQKASELFSRGIVDVEFRRTSCEFPGYNLIFKIVEQSHFPHYLAIAPMFYGGEEGIFGLEIRQEDGEEWKCMNKAWGGVWDLPNPPSGALKVKVKVGTSNGEQKWVEANKALPSSWKPGAGYDSHVKLA